MDVVMDKAWPEENVRRVKQMAIWYEQDGRDNPEHPQSGTYTGLAAKSSEKTCKESQPTPST